MLKKAAAVGMLAACAAATTTVRAQAYTAADKTFLAYFWPDSLAQISFARLATEKSKDPNVRQFAIRMLQDHSLLIDSLRPFAVQSGLTEPAGPTAADKARYLALKEKSGIAFDYAYVELMVANEHKDVGIYAAEAAGTKNADMAPNVAKAAAVVRQHAEMINGIAHLGGIPTPPIPDAR